MLRCNELYHGSSEGDNSRSGQPIHIHLVVTRSRSNIAFAVWRQRAQQSLIPFHRELVAEHKQALP